MQIDENKDGALKLIGVWAQLVSHKATTSPIQTQMLHSH